MPTLNLLLNVRFLASRERLEQAVVNSQRALNGDRSGGLIVMVGDGHPEDARATIQVTFF